MTEAQKELAENVANENYFLKDAIKDVAKERTIWVALSAALLFISLLSITIHMF